MNEDIKKELLKEVIFKEVMEYFGESRIDLIQKLQDKVLSIYELTEDELLDLTKGYNIE